MAYMEREVRSGKDLIKIKKGMEISNSKIKNLGHGVLVCILYILSVL